MVECSSFKMFKLFTRILFLSGFLVICCSAYTITPIIKPGLPSNTDITTAPFVKIGNGHYYFEKTKQLNWFDAYEHCRQMNASLISFETMEEWKFIDAYRKSLNDNNAYWTSGNDLANQGKHVWMSTGKPMTINVWAPGQPDNYQNNQHCDILGWIDHNGFEGMNDADCNKKYCYICEAPQPQTASFVIW